MGKKIVIIGGGPGGYTAAIRAAQLGAEVTLAEARDIGGTCLNVGCIPTKALLHTSEFYYKLKTNAVAGVSAEGITFDWQAAQSRKEQVVGRLAAGVGALLRHNGVRVLQDKALPMPDGHVKIGSEIIAADAVILATGSVSAELNFPGNDLPGVIGSAGALSLGETPGTIVIVGGGVIGIEFATLFSQLGAKVTLLEMLPQILPPMDPDVSAFLREMLENGGVDIHTGAALKNVAKAQSGFTACFDENGAVQTVHADAVLIAIGRKPNTTGLGLDELGVRLNKGAVMVDECFRTNMPNLYAVGDCNGLNMLAHAAMAQGVAAAGHIMGVPKRYNPKTIPSCVYSYPEIAAVGLTEKQARDAGMDYSVGIFDLGGNGKSLIDGAGGGFVKIIADKTLGEVLGVHIIGLRATELISEAALCMNMEGTVEDIVNSVHAHPTVSEAIVEAAMSVFGKPIHGI